MTLVATGFGENFKKLNKAGERVVWAERLNSAFFEKSGAKDDSETPKFGSRAVFGKVEERREPRVKTIVEPETKKSMFGFGNRSIDDAGDIDGDNLDVPPILRRGGSFKSMAVSREEEDIEPIPEAKEEEIEEPPMAAGDDDDLELPSFIRKKMK